MYKKEVIGFNNKNFGDDSLKPLFDFMLKQPQLLCLASHNFVIREIYANVTGAKPSSRILMETRGKIEKTLAAALGHADLSLPVAKLDKPRDIERLPDTERLSRSESWGNNMLLRALIRQEFIKGSLAPQK